MSENLSKRQAQLTNMIHDGDGNVRLEYDIPTRGLIGFRNAFLTLTQGNGAHGQPADWLSALDRVRLAARAWAC